MGGMPKSLVTQVAEPLRNVLVFNVSVDLMNSCWKQAAHHSYAVLWHLKERRHEEYLHSLHAMPKSTAAKHTAHICFCFTSAKAWKWGQMAASGVALNVSPTTSFGSQMLLLAYAVSFQWFGVSRWCVSLPPEWTITDINGLSENNDENFCILNGFTSFCRK